MPADAWNVFVRRCLDEFEEEEDEGGGGDERGDPAAAAGPARSPASENSTNTPAKMASNSSSSSRSSSSSIRVITATVPFASTSASGNAAVGAKDNRGSHSGRRHNWSDEHEGEPGGGDDDDDDDDDDDEDPGSSTVDVESMPAVPPLTGLVTGLRLSITPKTPLVHGNQATDLEAVNLGELEARLEVGRCARARGWRRQWRRRRRRRWWWWWWWWWRRRLL